MQHHRESYSLCSQRRTDRVTVNDQTHVNWDSVLCLAHNLVNDGFNNFNGPLYLLEYLLSTSNTVLLLPMRRYIWTFHCIAWHNPARKGGRPHCDQVCGSQNSSGQRWIMASDGGCGTCVGRIKVCHDCNVNRSAFQISTLSLSASSNHILWETSFERTVLGFWSSKQKCVSHWHYECRSEPFWEPSK